MDLYIKNYNLQSNKIKRDLTIFSFSDLHINESFDFNKLKLIITEACKTNPNIICFVGDLVEDSRVFCDKRIKNIIIDFFRTLSLIAPVYVIRGNHDYLTKKDNKWENFSSDCFFENLNNISNTHVLFNKTMNTSLSNVSISGQDLGVNTYKYYISYNESIEAYFNYVSSNIVSMEENLDSNDFNILCTHSPINCFDRNFSNYSLVISGHMHNGALPNFLDKILPGNFGFLYPGGKLFPRYARGIVSLEEDAYGVICSPVTMSAEFSNIKLVKKLYKPSVSYINVKSTK